MVAKRGAAVTDKPFEHNDVVWRDEQDTAHFAECLMRGCQPWQEHRALLIYLRGDLGAGKTTFSRYCLRAMGHSGAVKSPTYTLLEPYEHLDLPVYHFDLYRLADPEELEYLGIRDYISTRGLCLIEWPQKGAGVLPEADLTLTITIKHSIRQLVMSAGTAEGKKLMQQTVERLND